MTKIGAYISSEKDRLLEPRRYTTADEHQQMITRQVRIYDHTLLFEIVSRLIFKNVINRWSWDYYEVVPAWSPMFVWNENVQKKSTENGQSNNILQGFIN